MKEELFAQGIIEHGIDFTEYPDGNAQYRCRYCGWTVTKFFSRHGEIAWSPDFTPVWEATKAIAQHPRNSEARAAVYLRRAVSMKHAPNCLLMQAAETLIRRPEPLNLDGTRPDSPVLHAMSQGGEMPQRRKDLSRHWQILESHIHKTQLGAIRDYFKQQSLQIPAEFALAYIDWEAKQGEASQLQMQVKAVRVTEMLDAWRKYCATTPPPRSAGDGIERGVGAGKPGAYSCRLRPSLCSLGAGQPNGAARIG